MRVLIVEDEPAIRLLLDRVLRREGHTVRQAANVPQARAALAEEIFDLALLDYHVPGGTGLELCREIKARPQTRNISVVMVSSMVAQPEVAHRAFAAGCAALVSKPFDSRELLRAIANAIDGVDVAPGPCPLQG